MKTETKPAPDAATATEAAPAVAPNGPTLVSVSLDEPIIRGEMEISAVQVRKPKSGELRGLSLVDVGQLKVDALAKLLPRVTIPNLTEAEVHNLDPADLLAIGAEIGSFLLQKARKGYPTG